MSSSSYVTNSEVFYVRILVPFCLGIVFASIMPASFDLKLLSIVSITAFTLLLGLNLLYVYFRVYRFKMYLGVGIYFFVFLCGCISCVYNNKTLLANYFVKNPSNYLKISVTQEPRIKNSILMFRARVISGYNNGSQVSLSGNLAVSIRIDSASPLKIQYGDELIIPNSAKPTLANPNPATFDYKRWLEVQHIYHQIFLEQSRVVKAKSNQGNLLVQFALRLRAEQVSYFRKILEDDNVYAVASTLILGYRADLDEEVLGYYSKTGTIHALSVSGMHVGLIYLVLNWALGFLSSNRFSRLLKIILILLLIWAYTLITGLSPSVLRSAIMISVFIIGKGINRAASGYNILAFSAFILLAYDQHLIWDVGFQLSYLAVLGLLFLQPIIENWFYFDNVLIRKIWSAASISLAAQLFTFPLSVYYFHQFPVYFILSNLFILIPVTGIMYLGIAVLVFRIDFLASSLEWLIAITNSGLKYIAELPLSSLSSIWIGKTELLLLTVAISGMLLGLRFYKKSLIVYTLVLCLLIQTATAFEKISSFHQRKLVIYNIRNHYAIAFIDGREAFVLTKLSQEEKIFKVNIQPFLDQQQIQSITCVADLSLLKSSFLRLKGDDIQFYDYSISKTEIENLRLVERKAIVKNID